MVATKESLSPSPVHDEAIYQDRRYQDQKPPEPAPEHPVRRSVLQGEAIELLGFDRVTQLTQALKALDFDLDRLIARHLEIRDAIAERLQLVLGDFVGHGHVQQD